MKVISLPMVLTLLTNVAGFAVEPGYTSTEAQQIREELRRLKQDYGQRIEQLEQRLQQLEAAPGGTNQTDVRTGGKCYANNERLETCIEFGTRACWVG